MSDIKDTREETKSRRWLAIYGAYIAAQVQDRIRLTGDGYIGNSDMRRFMEEAETIADMEAEVGMDQ